MKIYDPIEITHNECRYTGNIRTADILLTKSNSFNSKFIQRATCAPVSHALVMISANTALEALPGGVQPKNLNAVMEESENVVLLRHRTLSTQQGLQIVQFLNSQKGKRYDMLGAARSATATGCAPLRYSAVFIFMTLLDEASKLTQSGHDKSFYCSELVARAFEIAGAPLTRHRPRNVSPGVLLRAEMLQVVRVIK